MHVFSNNDWSQTFGPHCVLLNFYVYACVFFFLVLSNMRELSEQIHNGHVDVNRMPSFDYSAPSSVHLEDYRAWFKQHGNNITGNLTDCDLEKEMQKVKT